MDGPRRCTRDRCASRDRETEMKQKTMKYELWMDRDDVQETDVHRETERKS